MDLLSQRTNLTTDGGGTAVGLNANGPNSPATAPPVLREQPTQGTHFLIPLPEPAPARQETAAKRAREAEAGDAEPPNKRKRTTGPSSEAQAGASAPPSETSLCAMPDDVLRLIAAALDTPEPLTGVRHLEWLRACCKDFRKRVDAPPAAVVLALKYLASNRLIRAALLDEDLDGPKVQAEVRALCDRYGDVRILLRNNASMLQTQPYLRHRNLATLAGAGESTTMRSLLLEIDGARDVSIKGLCDALRHKAPTRVSLTVHRTNWGNAAMAALLDRISESDAIVSLKVDGSGGRTGAGFKFMEQGGWGAKPVQSLRRMLAENRSLELLDLGCLHPGNDAIEAIAQALAINRTLLELRLPSNELSEKSMQLLGRSLGSNVKLATLKLDENRLGPLGAQGLLAGLRKNRTLTALSLSRCMASDATALELFRLFEQNDTLRTFELRHAAIKGPVVACLARLLQDRGRLETLDLSGSPVGPEGAQAIGDLLASDTLLTSLDLSHCSIGDDELRLIAQGLRENTRLRHLNLAMSTAVSSAGISALASALESHPRIVSLNLSGNRIDDSGMQALAASLLANHPSLEQLDLSGCATGPKGRRIIAKAMEANMRLKKLVMNDQETWFDEPDSD